MMRASRPKSVAQLERAITRYEAKLAKAPNPTQRRYAASMLSMARAALARTHDGLPVVEDPDGVVTLHPDEYDAS